MTRPMAKQMELFEDGGLKDEGGTVDPVSGNDVPPGSTKAEVRDDIPAQLSEGEFVFPADVVRFIGLEKLMKIRQRAKAGLQRMDDMGQMGNSEEAIMPDDLPFSIDDLDMEDDGLEMNVGGFVTPLPGPNFNMNPQVPGPMGMNPNIGMAPAPVGVDPNLSGTVFTPTTIQPTFPTYKETVGPGVINVDYENVTFRHEDGREIILRRDKRTGEIIDPIPDGFSAVDASKAAVGTTKTQTTQTRQDDGDGGAGDEGVGTTTRDVTGIGYDRSGLTSSLRDAVSKYGAGFGTLADTFIKGPRQALMGIPQDIATKIGKPDLFKGLGKPTALSNAATSSAFGGILDNFRQVQGGALNYGLSKRTFEGGSRRSNRQYGDTTALDQMNVVRQDVIAGVASVVMPEVQKLFEDDDGKALDSAKALSNVQEALSDLGLSSSQIDKIATRGGNFNQFEKLTRALGNLKVDEVIYGPKFDQVIANVSPEAKAAIEAGNVARNEGILGRDITQTDVDRAFAAADAAYADDDGGYTDEGFDDTGGGDVGVDASSGASTGYGSGTDCLTEDMKVKLNGVIDFVTNIKVGDIIDNYRVKEVLHKHMRNGYYAINNELKISNDHPVLANGIWTRPEDLVVGDNINGIPVLSLEYVEQLTPTVSIVIDGESFDVHTENNIYTVHGRYKEVRQRAA